MAEVTANSLRGPSLKVYTDALGVCEGSALGLDGGVGGLNVAGFVEGEKTAGTVVVFYFEKVVAEAVGV